MNKWVMGWMMVFGGLVLAAADSAEEAVYVPPALTPAPYLIRDPAVRVELKLTADQAVRLQALCDGMDEHLFALRDQPPVPTEARAIEHVRAVVKAMDQLPTILKPSQQGRLQELAIQFEGAMALFRKAVAECVGLSAAQKERMQEIYRQSLRMRDQLRRRLEESGDSSQYAQQAEQMQVRLMQQFLMGLTESQMVVWQGMLGKEFDFSRTQPVSFRAPDLPEVSRWIQTRPVSIKSLEGRVAAVIFFSPGSADCAGDYAVYKMWARQYDPKEVFVLGIHMPVGDQEEKTALAQAIEREGLEFPIAVDGKKTVREAWVNQVCPSVYLVDKTGRVRYWWYGPLRKDGSTGDQWLSERIEELRAETFDKTARQAKK
jgi:peroxiredoxin